MRLLGIDYGMSKIGLAIADDDSKMAVPFKILKEVDIDKQLELVLEIIKDENVDKVIIGLPTSLKQNRTDQTGITEVFVKALKEKGIDIVTADERLSSKAAQSLGVKEDDAVAAMTILQTYIDRH
ncbi:Holliday junction resolvase RuvX [Patescibacteria group bacterium]|nr:Holliday junction resolvase RuvX [Patescibacteria group bacterium]